MAPRREITKKYARSYAAATKKDKGRMLDELVGVTGWSRANARRAIAMVRLDCDNGGEFINHKTLALRGHVS